MLPSLCKYWLTLKEIFYWWWVQSAMESPNKPRLSIMCMKITMGPSWFYSLKITCMEIMNFWLRKIFEDRQKKLGKKRVELLERNTLLLSKKRIFLFEKTFLCVFVCSFTFKEEKSYANKSDCLWQNLCDFWRLHLRRS